MRSIQETSLPPPNKKISEILRPAAKISSASIHNEPGQPWAGVEMLPCGREFRPLAPFHAQPVARSMVVAEYLKAGLSRIRCTQRHSGFSLQARVFLKSGGHDDASCASSPFFSQNYRRVYAQRVRQFLCALFQTIPLLHHAQSPFWYFAKTCKHVHKSKLVTCAHIQPSNLMIVGDLFAPKPDRS